MTDSSNIFLSTFPVARLIGVERSATLRRIQRGDFGKPMSRGPGRATYVSLASVENFVGSPFTEDQVALAIGSVPSRRITIPQMQEN